MSRSDGGRISATTLCKIRISRSSDVRHLGRIESLLRQCYAVGAGSNLLERPELERALRSRCAVVAVKGTSLVGFAAARAFENGRFVGHTAVALTPELRARGFAPELKAALIRLSRRRWPDASILSLTLSPSVEELSKSLGFEPVPYCDLTGDPEFWAGCETCIHHGHLKRNQLQDCHCWAGLLPPPGAERERVIPKDAQLPRMPRLPELPEEG